MTISTLQRLKAPAIPLIGLSRRHLGVDNDHDAQALGIEGFTYNVCVAGLGREYACA